jgi:hypothetical protein
VTAIAAALRLLTGRWTDDYYFRHLEADRFGLFYDVPKPGWSHRAGQLATVLIDFAALIGALVALLLILIACTLAGPVSQ